MSQVSGVVTRISGKPTSTGGMVYNIQVDGEWYGYGFNQPQFNEGQSISFDYKQNGKFRNINPKSVQMVQGAPAQTQQQSPAQQPKSGGYQSNQLAIQYQASRNAAIHTVEVLLANGAAPMPTKKADAMDAVMALIDNITNQYHTKTDKVVQAGGVYDSEIEKAVAGGDSFE